MTLDFSKVANKGNKKEPEKEKAVLPEIPDDQTPPMPPVHPVKIDPQAIAKKAQEKFKWVDEKLEQMKEYVDGTTVKDNTANNQMIVVIGNATRAIKKIEATKKDITQDYRDVTKSVNTFANKYTDALKLIVKDGKRLTTTYLNQVELDRKKKEAEQKKKEDELKAKIKDEADAAGIEAPVFIIAQPSKEDRVVRTEDGISAFIKRPWKCVIIKPEKVPREYCEPSQKLLNQATKAGVREIEGTEIAQTAETTLRT